MNDFEPPEGELLDPLVKEVRVGETFCLLRGGDPDGKWVEAVRNTKTKLA